MKATPPSTAKPLPLPQPLGMGPYFDLVGCENGIAFEDEWRRLCGELGPLHPDTLVAASWAAVVHGVDVSQDRLPVLKDAEAVLRVCAPESLALGLNIASQGFCHWGLGDMAAAAERLALATDVLRSVAEDVHIVDWLRIAEFGACALRSADGEVEALDLLESTKELTCQAFFVHRVALAHVQLRAEILGQLELENPELLSTYRGPDPGSIRAKAAQVLMTALMRAAEAQSAHGNWMAAEECLSLIVDRLLSCRYLHAEEIEQFLSGINDVLRSARAIGGRRRVAW